MHELVRENGYLTVFLTVVVSGELGLFVGVALAHAGSVTLTGVVTVGTFAAFLSNTLYYCAGAFLWSRWGYLKRRFEEKVASTSTTVKRVGLPLMIPARFLYGVRNIVPLVLGIYRANILAFAFFNLVGSFVWVCAFAGMGRVILPGIVKVLGGS